MLKKRYIVAILSLAMLCSAMLRAAATTDIQKGGLVYIPDHSVFFADVDSSFSWAVHSVDYLANNKVISGTADLIYNPKQALTRADFASMLTRAYSMSDYVGGGSFEDVPDNAYYSDAVSAAKNLGIISGDEYGNFNPTKELTRQDAMVMLRRTLDRTGLQFAEGSLIAFTDASSVSTYARKDIGALAAAGIISGSNGKLSPTAFVSRAEMAVMLYRAMMLEPDPNGYPHFSTRPNIVNVCIGDTFYPNVTIEGATKDTMYAGLYDCDVLYSDGADYTIVLGQSRSMSQVINTIDGLLLVDGKALNVAENCDAVSVDPYGLISEGLVSTGEKYSKAAASVVDGVVTAVYYAK